MASISSLLKSAAAARSRIRSQEDAIVAYNWENSAQTYEDFLEYQKYLTDRADDPDVDPSDALSYQTKLRAARRSYTSNELQRQQMAIMEGRATTQDKMNKVKELYDQAIENEDYNLAQNLVSQWDSLSVQLQNEQDQAVRDYQSKLASGSSAAKKEITNLIDNLTKGYRDITLPTGEQVTPLAAIADDLKQTGGSTATWSAAKDTMEAVAGLIIDKWENATTQEEIDDLEQKYGKNLEKLYDTIFIPMPGVGKLTAQDVEDAIANEQFNNPLFGLKLTDKGYELKRNNTERIEYARTIDPATGQEMYAPLKVRTDQSSVMFGGSTAGRGVKTQILDDGTVLNDKGQAKLGTETFKRDDSQTIENRLNNLGIIHRQNGTTLMIKLPGENIEREATIQPDGTIRYMEPDGTIVEFGVVDREMNTVDGKLKLPAGQTRYVAPDEISDFRTASAFGGTMSQASAAGDRYLKDITGQSPVNQVAGSLKGTIRTGNDFSGFGTAVTTNLLQSAGLQRQKIEQENQRQIMLQAQQQQLQASQTMNLNQTPVRQFASNGAPVKQLVAVNSTPARSVTVAAPVKAPAVNVAKPTAQPKVTVQSSTYRASNRPTF